MIILLSINRLNNENQNKFNINNLKIFMRALKYIYAYTYYKYFQNKHKRIYSHNIK